MATQIPDKLKSADIQRFVHRANQVEKFKPAIAYWCRFFAVDRILKRGLGDADDACHAFAKTLIESVEQMKRQYSDDPAVVDDSIAQAFIKHFGLETFEKGDKAIRANSVSRITADTFYASLTFLDILRIWGPPDPETEAKMKYAKFHAARISKAIREGEDPNLSNPKIEPVANPDELELDPNDPEVQQINRAASHQPTVEDAIDDPDGLPDSHKKPDAAFSPRGQPSGGPSPVGSAASNPRKGSAGGGYFPEVASPASIPPNVPLPPSAPSMHSPSEAAAHTFYQTISPPPPSAQHPSAPSPQHFASAPHSTYPPPHALPHQQFPSAQPTPLQPPAPAPASFSPVSTAPINANGMYNTSDEAIDEAKKKAKWAASALDYDDINNAVLYLKTALRTLGAE